MIKQGHRLKVGSDSLIGQCIVNREARLALDVGEPAMRFENPLLPETRSELALSLITRGKVIGALTIQSARPAAFVEGDVAVFQTVANQLANAIENAPLFKETERALKELEEPHRSYIPRGWNDFLKRGKR